MSEGYAEENQLLRPNKADFVGKSETGIKLRWLDDLKHQYLAQDMLRSTFPSAARSVQGLRVSAFAGLKESGQEPEK